MKTTMGQLNRRITFQESTLAPDTNGDAVQTWTNVYQCWASIDVQNSQLTYATAEFVAKVTYRFTTRYTKSVSLNPAMRILYVDPAGITHTYEIESYSISVGPGKYTSFVAQLVEYGHKAPSGSTQLMGQAVKLDGSGRATPAFPWLRPAWDSAEGATETAITTSLEEDIDKAMNGDGSVAETEVA